MFVSFNSSLDIQNLSENIFNRSFGRLKGYTVTALNFVQTTLQNQNIAIPTSLAFSAISFITVSRINLIFINYISDHEWIDYLSDHGWIDNDNANKDRILVTIWLSANVLSTAALSLGFYQLLKPTIAPLTYTALNVVGIVATGAFFYWYLSDE